MQRTGSETSQDSDDDKIGSDAGGGVSYLGRARAKARLLSRRVVEEEAISALTLRDEASLYGGGRRSHFAVQARQRLFIDQSTRYLNQLLCGVYNVDACNRVCWTVYLV